MHNMNRSLAEHLGGTPHLSPLLRKARRLGLSMPGHLLDLAVIRGCSHYSAMRDNVQPVTDPGRAALSDAELAVALCSGAQAYDPVLVRCAAQLLGAPDIRPEEVVRLAQMERCECVMRHIALAAVEADTDREDFWRTLLEQLPVRPAPRPGVLPHRSRFMVQAGIVDPRRPRPRQQWLRPVNPSR